MATHSSILTWRSHGQRSLAGYSPRGGKVSGMIQRVSHHHQMNLVLVIIELLICINSYNESTQFCL